MGRTTDTMLVIEAIVTVIFTLELIYNFANAPKPRLTFLFKQDTLIDIVTIAPPILEWFIGKSSIGSVSFLRILRMFKVIRVIRIFSLLKKMGKDKGQDD